MRRAASPLATKAGRNKLQDATAAHHQKNTNNPNKEDGGVISFLSLATTAGREEDNNISTPPTPERTPQTPRQGRKTTAPGETTLPRSADLGGYRASSSPAPPQVASPRWGASSGILIPTRRRLHHLDDVPRDPNKIQAEPLPGAAGEDPPPPPCHATGVLPGGATGGGGGRGREWWGLGLEAAGRRRRHWSEEEHSHFLDSSLLRCRWRINTKGIQEQFQNLTGFFPENKIIHTVRKSRRIVTKGDEVQPRIDDLPLQMGTWGQQSGATVSVALLPSLPGPVNRRFSGPEWSSGPDREGFCRTHGAWCTERNARGVELA
jgi:hypothetical protein